MRGARRFIRIAIFLRCIIERGFLSSSISSLTSSSSSRSMINLAMSTPRSSMSSSSIVLAIFSSSSSSISFSSMLKVNARPFGVASIASSIDSLIFIPCCTFLNISKSIDLSFFGSPSLNVANSLFLTASLIFEADIPDTPSESGSRSPADTTSILSKL